MKIAMLGQQGSGKTTLAMFFSRLLMKEYPEIHLYTNVNAKGKNLFVIDDFAQIPLSRDIPKILIIDEAMFTLDSRSSSSKQNVALTRFWALLRKSNVVQTYLCTHRYGMLDVRVRDQLDYIIVGRKDPNLFHYMFLDVTTGFETTFTLPKIQKIYDIADFDTYDFPNPISSEGLQNNKLFTLKK